MLRTAVGDRRELAGQSMRAVRLGIAGVLGGASGALLLIALPATVFQHVVPLLILIAYGLVAVQPAASRWILVRHPYVSERSPALWLLVFLTAVHGGYFGAAQSVLLIAWLAIVVPDDLQRLNGLKNLLTLCETAVAAALCIAWTPVAGVPAALLAAGSIAGGQLGAFVGRRLSPLALRGAIVVVGVAVAVRLLA